ncbi:MAG: TolC family protein, partial [Alphaproteobacteria bacterium]
RAAEAQLGRALGREASRVPRVRPLNSQPIPTSLGADVEALLARAVEQRPDLAARQAEVRAANAEVERARAEYMPTIGFAGNYGFDSWDYSLGSTNDIRTNQPTWSTAFRVDWDVFRGFGRANAVREAKAASAQAQAALERERIDATAEVWTAYYDFQAARRKLEYAETLLASAKEAYEGTAKSYENGLADIVALLTAERDLATARATRVRARAELLTSAARLGYTVGLVVPEAEAR